MIPKGTQGPSPQQRLSVELRRGIGTLAILSALRTPTYGYSLQQALTDRGFEIEQGTLYPLLRRLEEQGLLESAWTVDEERPRKYYRLGAQGVVVLAELREQWAQLVKVVDAMLDANDATDSPAPVLVSKGETS